MAAALLLPLVAAGEADVQFDFYNTLLAPQGTRGMFLYPEFNPAVNAKGITTRDRIFRVVGKDASVTLSNLLWGDYRCEFQGVFMVTTNWITVPDTNAGTLLYATNLLNPAFIGMRSGTPYADYFLNTNSALNPAKLPFMPQFGSANLTNWDAIDPGPIFADNGLINGSAVWGEVQTSHWASTADTADQAGGLYPSVRLGASQVPSLGSDTPTSIQIIQSQFGFKVNFLGVPNTNNALPVGPGSNMTMVNVGGTNVLSSVTDSNTVFLLITNTPAITQLFSDLAALVVSQATIRSNQLAGILPTGLWPLVSANGNLTIATLPGGGYMLTSTGGLDTNAAITVYNTQAALSNSYSGIFTGTLYGDPSHLGIPSSPQHEGNILAVPPSIVLDCDVGTDVGDNSAAGMLIVSHLMGLCTLEAMTCCVAPGWISNGVPLLAVPYNQVGNMTQVAGAGFLEQLCQYYGFYPAFGFGNETNYANYNSKWSDPQASTIQHQNCGAVSNSFFPLKYATNYPVAYKVLRNVLANRKAVTLLLIGQLNNYAKLLASPADEISPLNGYQLVSNNVSRVVSMLGGYPHGTEYNVYTLARAAQYGITNTPPNVPLIFAGFELGQYFTGSQWLDRIKDLCPPWLGYLNSTNPTYMVFTNSMYISTGRAAWDSITALYAISNVKSNSWFSRVQGYNSIDTTYEGSNNFVAGSGPGDTHFYLVISTNMDRAVEAQLNSIGVAKPSPFLNMRITTSQTPAAGDTLRWDGTNRWYNGP